MLHRCNRLNSLALFAVAGTALGVAAGAANATALSWVTVAGGSAGTAANWNPAQVPVAADTLTFNLPNTFPVSFPVGVSQVTSHTYKRGIVTISLTSPHTTSSFVRVGDAAADVAQMIVTAGTLHAGTGVTVGNAAGSNGTMTVDNEGTLVDTTAAGSDIVVGASGTGTLNITDGAKVAPLDDVFIGGGAGSTGDLNVTGAGGFPLPAPSSELELEGPGQDVIVGSLGDGRLDVSSGGLVTCDNMSVSVAPGSTGIVTVGGTGGILNVPATINVATTLRLGDNAAVGQNGGSANFTVNAGGEVNVGGATRIGDPTNNIGSGTLTINEGGVFTTASLIATDTGGFLQMFGGELRINGGSLQPRNDVLTLSSTTGTPQIVLSNDATCSLSNPVAPFETLVIGNGGFGDFIVGTGSSLHITSGDIILGNLVSGSLNGRLLCQHGGSNVTAPSGRFVIVGDAGRGILTVSSTAQVTCGSVHVGRAASGIGFVEAAAGGTLNITGTLAIGGTAAAASGMGSVTISGGGTIEVSSGRPGTTGVRLWSSGDILNVQSGGTLRCDGDIVAEQDAAFNLSGGEIDARGTTLRSNNTTYNARGTVRGRLELVSGLSTLALNGDLAVLDGTFQFAAITNSGLIEVGNHTLSVEGPLSDSRDLNTCHVEANGRIVATEALTVSAGFSLSGDGTIDAPIINSGAVVSEGGGLTFSKVLSGVGTGISGTRITFASGGGFTGSGAFSTATPITALSGSVITATGNLTMGTTSSTTGFSGSGLLVVPGPFVVTLLDSNNAVVTDVEFPNSDGQAPSVLCATGLAVTDNVTGSGTIGGDFDSPIALSGNFKPGTPDAPGRIDLRGDTTVGASSRLEFDIFSATDHDHIHTVFLSTLNPFPDPATPHPSDITLGGTLVVRVAPGHTPTNGETHHIISTGNSLLLASGNVLGDFAAAILPPKWHYEIRPGSLLEPDGLFVVFCSAEFNNDGSLDPDDLGDFINCFFASPPCPEADFNADGDINPDDLGDFINLFFAGCP